MNSRNGTCNHKGIGIRQEIEWTYNYQERIKSALILEDLKALRDVKLVAIRGQVIENPEIKRFDKVENALNPLL